MNAKGLRGLLVLGFVWIAACGQAAGDAASGAANGVAPTQSMEAPPARATEGGGALPPSIIPSTEEPPVPTPSATEVALPAEPDEPTAGEPSPPVTLSKEEAVVAARTLAAKEAGVGPEDLRLVSAEAREWPNAALDCPQPGMGYAEVITPGYRVVLEAGGDRYDVRLDASGRGILCRPAAAAATPGGGPALEPARGGRMDVDKQRALRAARTTAARAAGVEADRLSLLATSAEEWPNAALGCPEPGKTYAQAVTPGYRFVFGSGEERYEVRAAMGGTATVLCRGGVAGAAPGAAAPATRDPEERAAQQAARRLLVERAGVAPGDVAVVSSEAVEWPDSSLGCPRPGMMYAQVITPGFKVTLHAEGEAYEVHTDEGRSAVLCDARTRADRP